MNDQASSCYLRIHQDVLDVLESESNRLDLDMTLPSLLRFLVTYGRSIQTYYLLDSLEIIRWLDDSYRASDGSLGRVAKRLHTSNPALLAMDGEEAYQCLVASMLYLDFDLSSLEVGDYSY